MLEYRIGWLLYQFATIIIKPSAKIVHDNWGWCLAKQHGRTKGSAPFDAHASYLKSLIIVLLRMGTYNVQF